MVVGLGALGPGRDEAMGPMGQRCNGTVLERVRQRVGLPFVLSGVCRGLRRRGVLRDISIIFSLP